MRLATHILLVVISSLSTAAAQPQQRPSLMVDVALSGEGHLISHCQDTNGSPVSGAVVELIQDDQVSFRTTSRSDGSFVLRDVRPGTYRLQCGDCDRTIRVWSESAAPPIARVPIAVQVSAATPPAVTEEILLPSSVSKPAAEVSEPTADDEEPSLQLQLEEGSRRRTSAPVEQTLPEVALAVNAEALPSLEFSSQNRHAHQAIETVGDDAPFDPFAGPQPNVSQANEPGLLDSPQKPLAASVQTQGLLPEPAATAVGGPGPQHVPCPGNARCIPRSVGPTVGDVVVTSLGIAGITMGIIGIHKYENRRVRRAVSP